MTKREFTWSVSHSDNQDAVKEEKIPATVPGAIGLDYAKAHNYPEYYFGTNYENFAWMEDKYFTYSTELDFFLSKDEFAYLVFEGIDYEFDIKINGEVLLHKEGMFTPSTIDVSAYNGNKSLLEVVVYPIPKLKTARRKGTREEAAASCKPASSYSWDWHPRLVPSGIWKPAYLEIHKAAPLSLDASYRLSDDLKEVYINAEISTIGSSSAKAELLDPDGNKILEKELIFSDSENVKFAFSVKDPQLWYPVGYGEHPIYTFAVYNDEKRVERKIGFRRVKLIRNFDDTNPTEKSFPKGRYSAPATIEINGTKIFAKGSNMVNIEIFPCLMNKDRYDGLLKLISDAHMNIVRMWGGGFINHDCFYDLCDSYGIMVWQEFMLSCNVHPDDDKYLDVLKNEATHIIKTLRTHPCIALWCGGNELFNSWSGMTDQSHPLRMLNSLCYELDRFTPFNATSPLEGMGHGNYNTLSVKHKAKADSAGLGGEIDCNVDEEFITTLTNSYFTAYTEFGSSGGATPEYIKKYIMSEEDYNAISKNHPIWKAHHAFNAWNEDSWLRLNEMDYYFGGYESTEDLMKKSLFVQSISYKSLFEEMRKQWPHCSMAINWDFNEPWPCAAGNSLVNWPLEPKPAYYAVKEALRPTIASIRTRKNRFTPGETLRAEVFMLNDSSEELSNLNVCAYLVQNGELKKLASFNVDKCGARSNAKLGVFDLKIDEDIDTIFTIKLDVENHSEMSSVYQLINKK